MAWGQGLYKVAGVFQAVLGGGCVDYKQLCSEARVTGGLCDPAWGLRGETCGEIQGRNSLMDHPVVSVGTARLNIY